jgi:hypothetical protein
MNNFDGNSLSKAVRRAARAKGIRSIMEWKPFGDGVFVYYGKGHAAYISRKEIDKFSNGTEPLAWV